MRARIGLAVALAASTALLCQGCISTDFRPSPDFTAAPLRSGPPSSVRVLPAPPPVPFSVLGEIEASVTGFYSDAAVLKRVLRAAAARGANAVVFARDGYMTVMRCTGPGEDCGPEQKRCSVVYLALRVPEPSESRAAGPPTATARRGHEPLRDARP